LSLSLTWHINKGGDYMKSTDCVECHKPLPTQPWYIQKGPFTWYFCSKTCVDAYEARPDAREELNKLFTKLYK
jgi:hypothetical protein